MNVNSWYDVQNQSLALYASRCGFDMSMYESYSESVKAALRSRTIQEAVREISYEYEEKTGEGIDNLRKGVYVISISLPLTIKYTNRSNVIYVGIGNVLGRLKQHFESKLFDFMLSLNGANFDFRFAKPELEGFPSYYKHIEYLLLEEFRRVSAGGAQGQQGLPMRWTPFVGQFCGLDKLVSGVGFHAASWRLGSA